MDTYRGPDRRRATTGTTSPIDAGYAVVALVLATLMAVSLARRGDAPPAGTLGSFDLVTIATVAITMVAGFLQLERWRVSGFTTALWTGAAAFLCATMIAGRRLLPAFELEVDRSDIGSFSLACTVLVIVVACWTAIAPDVHATIRPRTVAITTICTLAGATIVFHELDLELRTRIDPAPGTGPRLLLAGGWALAGTLLVLRSRRQRGLTTAWFGLLMFAIAGAEAAAGLHFHNGVSSSPSRLAMIAVGAAGLLYASERDLRAALADQAHELDDTRAQANTVGDQVRSSQAAAAERAHEARNALAAIDGAIRTLERYQDRLPEDTKAQLAAGVTSEISRLQRLVDVDERAEAASVFRVADVLTPVVMLARTQGLEVETDMRPDVEALAPREATIEVVQNLLINAQRHAGGKGVVLQVGTDGDRALVRVLDRGPGVTPDRRESIFERGQPEGDAGGRGFGLYLSRRLVEAHGGRLVVGERKGGGARFEFDLPLAPSVRRIGSPPVDHREHVRDAHEAGRA